MCKIDESETRMNGKPVITIEVRVSETPEGKTEFHSHPRNRAAQLFLDISNGTYLTANDLERIQRLGFIVQQKIVENDLPGSPTGSRRRNLVDDSSGVGEHTRRR